VTAPSTSGPSNQAAGVTPYFFRISF
jgi:hypothetical protein